MILGDDAPAPEDGHNHHVDAWHDIHVRLLASSDGATVHDRLLRTAHTIDTSIECLDAALANAQEVLAVFARRRG